MDPKTSNYNLFATSVVARPQSLEPSLSMDVDGDGDTDIISAPVTPITLRFTKMILYLGKQQIVNNCHLNQMQLVKLTLMAMVLTTYWHLINQLVK